MDTFAWRCDPRRNFNTKRNHFRHRGCDQMNWKAPLVSFCFFLAPILGEVAAQDSYFTATAHRQAATDPLHGWYAGVEATFLVPDNLGAGPVTFEKAVTGGDVGQVSLTDFAEFENMEGAPRVWLGRRGEIWGLRGRYWLFDADTSSAMFGVAGTEFTFLSASQLLSAKTGDLEVTRCFGLGEWNGDLFLGARWAEFDRRASMSVGLVDATSLDPPVIVDRDAAWFGNRTITSGVGLTFGWDARRPVGDWGLALVFNARGSSLWGNAASRGYQSYLGESALAVQTAEVDDPGILWIGELQTGLEWSGSLQYFNAEVFTHVVFEYQFWRASNQTPFRMDETITTPNGTATLTTGSFDSDVDLFGIAWAVGFRR